MDNLSFSENEHEHDMDVLEKIARQYPAHSEEAKILEKCAQAICFIQSQELQRKFRIFMEKFNSELTPKERQKLEELGIDLFGEETCEDDRS